MKLYQRYEGLSPIYQGYLTNHLPMLFQILREWQVDKKTMIDILDKYKKERDLYSLTDPMYPTSDFEKTYIQRTSHYLGDIHKYGEDVVIGNLLNRICKKLHGHLFHGLIRLMYAVRSKNDLLIAQGLSYLSLVADIDELTVRVHTFDSVVSNFDYLYNFAQKVELDDELPTMDRLYQLYNNPEIQSTLQTIDRLSSQREKFLTWILSQYKKNRGFLTLHVITGFHALLELEEYFVDFDKALQSLCTAAQLFMAMDTPKEHDQHTIILKWEDITNDLLKLQDVHEMKLVFSLIELAKGYPIKDLREIASIIYAKQ